MHKKISILKSAKYNNDKKTKSLELHEVKTKLVCK